MTNITYNIQYKDNNNWLDFPNWVLPLTDKQTLDETLDMGTLFLSNTYIKQAYEPFTQVRVTINQDKDGKKDTRYIYRYISWDKVDQVSFFKDDKRYSHRIELIEPSKILERYVVDNITFTNTMLWDYRLQLPLAAKYQEFSYYESFASREWTYKYNASGTYYDSYLMGASITVFPVIVLETATAGQSVSGPYQKQPITKYWGPGIPEQQISAGTALTFNNAGTYYITYSYQKPEFSERCGIDVIYVIEVVNTWAEKEEKDYTLVKAIDRLLSITPTRQKNIAPLFKLSNEARTKYTNVLIPEKFITGNNLWEALSILGNYVHAIPYLRVDEKYPNWDTIDFYELGSNEVFNLSDKYSQYSNEWDCNLYCTSLDTVAENIMNIDNENQGTITEPYYDGYISPRTEDGNIIISEDTMLIPTKFGIEKVTGLWVRFNSKDYDWIPFVYEQSQYNLLSSYDKIYPSLYYALQFKQGQKNITNLQYKVPDEIGQAGRKDPAYKNIMSILEMGTTNDPIDSLKFKITYIPHVTARIKQYKQNALNFKTQSALQYNQQASKIDSLAYGENLKGVIARIGNRDETYTFHFEDINDIPTKGTLTDTGYYIATVHCEYFKTFIKCLITLTKDYNKLYEQVAIKNEIRYYEIAESKALNRYINYPQFAIIGNDLNSSGNESIITDRGVQAYLNTFLQQGDFKPCSSMNLIAYDSASNQTSSVTLPAMSLGIGNSVIINATYQDNYSAGNKSASITSDNYKRAQIPVPYTDKWGELKELNIDCVETHSSATGNALYVPEQASASSIYFSTNTNRLVVEKDNREIINLTVQLNSVVNRSNIIIGSALSQCCPLASGINSQKVAKLVLLDYTIGKFDRNVIPYYTQSARLNSRFTVSGKKIAFGAFNASRACKAWALVTADNELLIGCNEVLTQGQTSSGFYINFVRELKR